MTKSRGIQNTWSPAEKALLTRLWPQIGYACADQFKGRSVKSVADKARALGLRAPKAEKRTEPKPQLHPAERGPFRDWARQEKRTPPLVSIWHYAETRRVEMECGQ